MTPRKPKDPDNPSGHVLDDLDRAILSVLPEEGTKIGLYMPKAPTASEVRRELKDQTIGANLIGARLGLMRKDGLAIMTRPPRTGGTNGWQRTAKGKREAANIAAEGGTQK